MLTEVANETVNIGDYIWYIIGGAALFFVLVGFIADKSGLIKKTFGKSSKSSNNVASSSNTLSAKKQNIDSAAELDQEATINTDDVLPEDTNNLSIDESPVTLDDVISSEQEAYDEPIEGSQLDDLIINNNDLMLDSDDKIVEGGTTDDVFMLSSEDIENKAEENEQEELVKENSVEDNNEEQNIEDDVWGFDEEDNEKETSEEVNAPDLEEVNGEEDVWKF